MRKARICLWFSMAAAASFLLACTGGKQKPCEEGVKDSIAGALPDTAFYGHLGEGTGMSCLELVTDGGDTLVLNKTDERTGDLGRILGEIANYTDRYAITTCDDNQSVCVALNISQMLQKKWQSDTDRQRGFRLEADGKAYSLSGKRVYKGWSLCNCDLVLAQEVGNDTLAVLELSPDSLVLQGRKGGEIEVFHSI